MSNPAFRLSVFLSLVSVVHAQRVYYTTTTAHTIWRAEADGSNVVMLVDTSPDEPYSIAVDALGRKIYWSTTNGQIRSANLDGTQVGTVLETAVWGIAVDDLRKRLYWCFGEDFFNGLRRAESNGGDEQWIFDSGNSTPERVSVDPVGEKIYWSMPTSNQIWRAQIDGSHAEAIVTVPEPLLIFAIAVDPRKRRLYWSSYESQTTNPGRINSANLDGTQVQVLPIANPDFIFDVAVDPGVGKLFWRDDSGVHRANLDGTNSETIVTSPFGLWGPMAVESPASIPTVSVWGALLLMLSLSAAGVLILRPRRRLWANKVRALAKPAMSFFFGFSVCSSAQGWEGISTVDVQRVDCEIDSGWVSAPGSGSTPVVVFDTIADCLPYAFSVRLHFESITLSGSLAAGNASYVRLTSLADGSQQLLSAGTAEQWKNTSGYIMGEQVRIEIVAFPGTGSNRVVLDGVVTTTSNVCDSVYTTIGLCDTVDRRSESTDPRSARLRYSSLPTTQRETQCSSFLVSNGSNWFLTAGHCCKRIQWEPAGFLPLVEFDVPQSNNGGDIIPAHPDRQFPVEIASIQFMSPGTTSSENDGLDWCFFAVHPNSNTGLTPVQTVNGSYRLSSEIPAVDGRSMRVTGFGVDNAPFTACRTEQTATGAFIDVSGTSIRFAVDVQPGNSGSPVEDVCGHVLAVLTDGHCEAEGSNLGTSVTLSTLTDALTPNHIVSGVTEPIGAARDCNQNGIADWCDVSCGSPGGACDIPGCGQSANCNNNLIPDECESYADCNANAVRDICEVAAGTVPDCNQNGVPDSCDLAAGFSKDCNCDGLPDECDICVGTSDDLNNDWIPDECATLRACCRPAPYEDCVVTSSICCDVYDGEFKPTVLTCKINTCPAWNGPSWEP